MSSAITWYKDGRPLSAVGGEVTLLRRGAVLEVGRARMTDAGLYRCVAVNLAGSAETSHRLLVHGELRALTQHRVTLKGSLRPWCSHTKGPLVNVGFHP